MMFKKIRKYLVVLMAVAIVASFAVIPTSAAVNGNNYNYIVDNGYEFYRDVWVSAYGDENFYTKARMYDPNGNLYDCDCHNWLAYGSGYSGTAGPICLNYALAAMCYGYSSYGAGTTSCGVCGI